MDPAQHSITVVVVAYGPERQLAACLDALGRDRAVVVVDNGRSELCRTICAGAGTTYVAPSGNIGFAAAVNVALREHRAPGSHVLLLNPDARLRPSDLVIMLDELDKSTDLAAVGPRLVGPDGEAQKALWPFPSPWTALAAVVGGADRLTRNRFVSGAVLLLRGDAIDALGMLDERFFLYAEEADWQLRAVRAGWRVGVVAGAAAVHVSGGTSSEAEHRELLFNASAERFVRKWYGTPGWQVFRLASILAAYRRWLLAGDEQSRGTQHRAIFQYWRGPVRCAEAATGDT